MYVLTKIQSLVVVGKFFTLYSKTNQRAAKLTCVARAGWLKAGRGASVLKHIYCGLEDNPVL